MTNKMIIGGVVVLLVVAAGIFVLKTLPRTSAPASVQAPTAQQAATSTYATTTFSVVYPQDFIMSDAHVYDQVNPKKPIHGVKFTIPAAMAAGTNLASDTYLAVEQLPRAKNCTGDIYLAADVKASTVQENGAGYSVATSSGVAAGNLYDETIYALSESSPCTAVRYYIHSMNIGNYATGTREFDRQALLNAFDTIRTSLRLGGAPASVPGSTTTTP
ncbi:MAG: hypothetical protein AAB804_00165 [Patescibacteria group bacterium]